MDANRATFAIRLPIYGIGWFFAACAIILISPFVFVGEARAYLRRRNKLRNTNEKQVIRDGLLVIRNEFLDDEIEPFMLSAPIPDDKDSSAASATSPALSGFATSFTLSASTLYNEGASESRENCSAAETGGIKLTTTRSERKAQQTPSQEKYRELQRILPDKLVAHESNAVTYLSVHQPPCRCEMPSF